MLTGPPKAPAARRPLPSGPAPIRRQIAGKPPVTITGEDPGSAGEAPAREHPERRRVPVAAPVATGHDDRSAVGAPPANSPAEQLAAPVPPVLPTDPALLQRLEAYWGQMGRSDRIFWFEMAGFRVAYSATNWPTLARLVPQVTAALAEAIIQADFPPEPRR